MCGICGFVVNRRATAGPVERQGLTRMLECMRHRGPDDAAMHLSGRAAFAATRLAIRGISNGSQPIVDPKTGVTVVCNGEIDNYRELREWLRQRGHEIVSDTDIAVIPGLYLEHGPSFVRRLAGAFAIAVWDPRTEELVLARDRAGERPLFFAQRGEHVHFATEISALAALGTLDLRPDPLALELYLRRGYFPAPCTPFVDVHKVGPGEVVVFDVAGVHRNRYWRWPIGNRKGSRPTEEEFDSCFRRAVLQQTDIDVPFGLFLSGGLDSSLVAVVLETVRPEARPITYTVRFDVPSFDESDAAQRLAERLGLANVAVDLTAERLPAALYELVASSGEPLADPAWIATSILAERASRDVKLVLTGEGADELFGGYPTYLGARAAKHWQRIPFVVRAQIARAVHALPASEKKVSLTYLLKRFVAEASLPAIDRHLAWTAPIAPDQFAVLGLAPEPPSRIVETDVLDVLDRTQLMDLEGPLAEGLTTKSDRGGMNHGLELRTPFLDHGILEFAARLPSSDRVRGVRTKVFLKRYAERYLDRDTVHRRKRGLSLPLARWLATVLADWVHGQLTNGTLERVGVRERGALVLFDEHRRGSRDHSRALWSLCVLSEWFLWSDRRSFLVTKPAEALPPVARLT